MRFSVPWTTNRSFGGEALPLLDLFFRLPSGEFQPYSFLVDSGADISMAPAAVAAQLNLDWDSGTPIEVEGISPKVDCKVAGRILPVEVHILEAQSRLVIPVCFAEGTAPYLIGRSVFFDVFRIQFAQSELQTHFESVED